MNARHFLLAIIAITATPVAWADPCGMVPPIGGDLPIARVGDQQTYVFYHRGTEDIVIRPGFRGKTEKFGMLVPFPAVPAIRKVSDQVFEHITAAVDPPEVNVYTGGFQGGFGGGGGFGGAAGFGGGGFGGLAIQRDQVKVVKEEAVGMYEVAVLEAGSAQALSKWMKKHGYRYPDGMDAACEDYVNSGWCFVAVKTRVAVKRNVDPKPGMRKVSEGLPAGSTFDGHVQAMGFRFHTRQPVIPMRLSTFNAGDLHNIVYLLTSSPARLKYVPSAFVRRQVPGSVLYTNLTQPLPLRIHGGGVKDLSVQQRRQLRTDRDPIPVNGVAAALFADDLRAAHDRELSLPHEEQDKMLARIDERLGLRGHEIDRLHDEAVTQARTDDQRKFLKTIRPLTLTVIDGDFPRNILAEHNLELAQYTMPSAGNTTRRYNARTKQSQPFPPGGLLIRGTVQATPATPKNRSLVCRWLPPVGIVLGCCIFLACRFRHTPA